MKLENIRVGLCITGSFCNFDEVHNVITALKDAGVKDIYPIVSFSTNELDTRFGKSKDFIKMLKEYTGHNIIDTIAKAEPVGPKNLVDIIVICPCTGNTLAKLAHSITDTPVLMAVKGHIRNDKPVVIGISTNDGLGGNLENIGRLLNTKNMYFIPFAQDDYAKKPKSLVMNYDSVVSTLENALEGKQIQPVLYK